jgi:spermidine synthase
LKSTLQIASTTTPDGSVLALFQHDMDYMIRVDGQPLMSSRAHESELELARLGCARIRDRQNPRVLIGGLGMGYTLRETIDLLNPLAEVVVAELMPEVVRWNRERIGQLTDHPLRDKRVTMRTCDVLKVAKASPHGFDAILLDVDNGPGAFTDESNDQLYGHAGIQTLLGALHEQGCLSIWSASIDRGFERRLQRERLHVRQFRVAAHRGAKTRSRCIWVASRDVRSLPPSPRPAPPSAKKRAGRRRT